MSTVAPRDDNPIDLEAQTDDSTDFFIGVVTSLLDTLEDVQGQTERLEQIVEAANEQQDKRIEQLEARVKRLEQENNDLKAENEELRSDREQLKDEFEAYREATKTKFERMEARVDELEQENEEHGELLENDSKVIGKILDRVRGQEAATGDSGESAQLKTPIEQLLDDPVNSGINITASVQRAMRIVGNFTDWSKKTGKNRTINDNLKLLLEAQGGESLYWKQVYRAGKKVEELTNGAIEFIKTEHNGWVLHLKAENKDFLTRVVSVRNGG